MNPAQQGGDMNEQTRNGIIDFYFDFSSPYAYFASTRIEALAARHGREVRWHPILLGVVFKTVGTQALTTYPVKGDYAFHDFERTARFRRIPYNRPPRFPLPTQAAARAMLWAMEHLGAERATPLMHALFRAMFVDGVALDDANEVLRIAEGLGMAREALAAGIESAPIRDRLRTETTEALARGVFGAPFMIVDGEPFWGFDRFDQLEAHLRGALPSALQPQGENDMAMKHGYKAMVADAESRIKAYSAEEALARLNDPNVQFVDIRDVRELEREGVLPGAFHAPRGMLEFWVDPESPYHKPVFAQPREYIFFCAAGWRSALATDTVQRMGLEPVAHVNGGFAALKAAGAPVTPKADPKAKPA
jgi:2-hydroxychromene-2-carboxylate isomerase/rhodanese-related sulfurtransferase